MLGRFGTVVFAVGASSLAAAAFAQAPPPPGNPKAAVDALFAAYDRSDSPGCSVGVFQNGRIEYSRGYGMANLELGVANSPQTVFDIGSLAKQFTAFSVLLLARDGKLSVDDDIRKYVPEIPDYGKRVTIRHLLHHTGGLRDYIGLLALEGLRTEDVTTEQEALDALARQRAPLFSPGARYQYSNSGYFLLGIIVKRASGRSLRDFAQERIFGPLGMTHTQYNEDHTRIIPNRATGYEGKDGGGFRIDMSDFEQNGDGGVLTTIEDLLLWDRNFTDPAVGDRRLLEEMQRPGSLADGKPIDYASGLRIGQYRGLQTVGHTGSWAGYRALLYRFPDHTFSIAILCNRSFDRLPLMRRVAEVYLGDLMEKEAKKAEAAAPAKVALSASELARLAGAYRDPLTGDVCFLSVEAGKPIKITGQNPGDVRFLTADAGSLVADLAGQRAALDPIARDLFAPREGGSLRLRFVPRPGGSRPALEATWSGESAQTFEPIEVWSPTPAQVAAFAGDYVSDEVGGVLRFVVSDGRLRLRHRVYSDSPWRPAGRDSFASGGIAVTFTNNPAGKVTGLLLDTGGMKGIVYRRIGE